MTRNLPQLRRPPRLPAMPDLIPKQELPIQFQGTAPLADSWAAVWIRTGLLPRASESPLLLLCHGKPKDKPGKIPILEVQKGDELSESAWREHFTPILADFARAPESFCERHITRLHSRSWRLDFDLPLLAKGILAGWHENTWKKDRHGRPLPEASLLSSLNLLDRPVLDEMCRELGAFIGRMTGCESTPPPWWFIPTLDLDSPGLFTKRGFPSYFRRVAKQRPASLPRLAFDGFRTSIRILKDPHIRHRQIGEVLEGMNIHGAFFTQVRRWHQLDNYNLKPRGEMARDLRAILENRFHDVGLHSSFATIDRGEVGWKAQWKRLRRTIGKHDLIHRSHYLRWPATQPWPSPVDEPYVDSSLGYGGREGFRRGTAFPFPLRPDAVELPPTVMDSTLIYHRKMTPGKAWDVSIALLERVRLTGGVFVPIWHPNNMDDYLFPGWGELLYDLSREAMRRGAMTCRPTLLAREYHQLHEDLRRLFIGQDS